MADKNILSELEEREQQIRDQVNEYEDAAKIAKSIATLQKKKDELQKDISTYLTTSRPDAGTIKRLTAGLSALSPVDAIYKANENAIKNASSNYAASFAKNYAKSIGENLQTAFSGKDYTLDQKKYKDILTKQMGLPDNTMTTIAGILGDMTVDPTTFGAMKPVFKTIGKMGSMSVELASKVPNIGKGIEAIKKSFNIFYDIEKTGNPEIVTKFKDAFRIAAESKDFSKLAVMGLDVSRYVSKNTRLTEYSKYFRDESGKFASSKEYQKILDTAFGPQRQLNLFEKGIDKYNSIYKYIMSWSPIFQTRNALGATFQGVSEGVGLKDYFKASQLVLGKGKNNPELYKTLQESGVLSQYGMFGAAKYNPFAMLARFSESVNRAALALHSTGSGKSLTEAIGVTEKVFYKYGKEYLTPFEKNVMSRILPFYSFNKGQMGYWPGALGENAAFLSNFGKLKEDTLPGHLKSFPYLRPDYEKDMFTVGSYGSFGFQAEDFLKNITGNFQNMFAQLNPAIKTLVEGISGWNVFAGKPISSIKGGGAYNLLPDNVNPWGKWITELNIGSILQPFKNLLDPNKPLASAFTSIRDYNFGLPALLAQSEMNQRNPGFWKSKFGFGTPSASAAAAATFGNVGQINSAMIADWAQKRNIPAELFGKQYVIGGGGDQTMFFNWSQRLGEDIAKGLQYNSDIGKGFAESFQQTLANRAAQFKFENVGSATQQKIKDADLAYYNAMRPRLFGEDTFFHPEDMKYRMTMGATPLQQAYNRALEEKVSFVSKTADIWKSSFDRSPEQIKKALQFDIAAINMQMNAQYGGISQKDAASRIEAKKAEAEKALRELEARGHVSIGNLYKDWADSEVNTLTKIELQRKEAIEKYHGSDDFRDARADKNRYEEIKLREAAINSKYDKLRQDELTKLAKEQLELVKTITKGEAENLIAVLDGIYKRGGMSIEQYYGNKLIAEKNQYVPQISSSIDVLKSTLSFTSPGIDETTKSEINKKISELDEIKKIITDPQTDPKRIIEVLRNLFESLNKQLSGIDEKAFSAALSELSQIASKLQGAVTGSDIGIQQDNDKLNKAVSEVNEYYNKIKADIYGRNSIATLGIRSISGSDVKFGYRTSPYAPAGYDANAVALEAQKNETGEKGAQYFQNVMRSVPGDLAMPEQENFETGREYMMRVETALEEHERNKENISAAGKEKLKTLEQAYATYVMQQQDITAQNEAKTMQQRLSVAQGMTSLLAQTAETIWNASNGKCKEAFYIMKALAIADATIKGFQSAVSAFNAGVSIGGPNALAYGYAFATASMAFTGAQIGAMVSQMVTGPEGKKEGGLITQGSGTKDDVPIMAMRDEFVMRQSAVRKYGVGFMEALNKGLLPVSSMNFAIPNIPESNYQIHFAEGGRVGAAEPPAVSVQLKNESGTPLKSTRAESSFNGQEYVVSVWIDAVQRNVGGLRDVLAGGQ